MTEDVIEELKPCPFCGGEAETMQEWDYTDWVVFCLCCQCSLEASALRADGTGKKFKTRQKAIKGWNTRTS